MGSGGVQTRNMIDAKNPRLSAVLVARGIVVLFAAVIVAVTAMSASAAETSEAGARKPAVAAPNLRLGFEYEFLHVGSTETTNGGTTLRIPNLDGHAGRADLVGSFPILGPLGGRILGRARYGHTRRNLDGLDRGNNEVSRYGVGAELFLRDPDLGSFSVGGGFDRDEGEGSVTANEWSGTTEAAIFFPDLGSGPVDWVVNFSFAHQTVSGVPGPIDIDSDRYVVSGSAGWYLTDNFQFILGGRWRRAEEEFANIDERVGLAKARWRVPGPVSVELALGGFAGVSDYKQSPFRSENRLTYGVNASVVLRIGSGATLLESVRQFD